MAPLVVLDELTGMGFQSDLLGGRGLACANLVFGTDPKEVLAFLLQVLDREQRHRGVHGGSLLPLVCRGQPLLDHVPALNVS